MTQSSDRSSSPAAPADSWARAAGLAGALLIAIGLLMLVHSSRPENRQVLGRWSWSYVGLVAALVAWGAWWCGGLRQPGSRWRMGARRTFRGAIEAAALALFTFALLEGVCRIAERPLSRFIGGPALIRSYQTLVQLDSHGLRNPERPLAKPQGTWRLVMLGDSFTFGNGVPGDSTCARRLERLLARPGGPPVEVINAAIPGFSTIQERAMLDTLGLRFEPDLVLLAYVLNDPDPKGLAYPALLPAAIGNRMRWSVALAAARATAYYVMVAAGLLPKHNDHIRSLFEHPESPDWKRHVAALEGIVADARATGAPVVGVVWPLPDPVRGFSPYPFGAAQETAVHAVEAAGAMPLDLLPVFAKDRYAEFALSEWDPHPNASANRRAAFAIAKLIEERGLGPRAGAAAGASTRPATR